MGKIKNLALWSLIAAGVGYIVGLLTAPKSGKETRQDIADSTHRVVTESENKLHSIYDELLTQYEIATARAKELRGQAKKEADAIAKLAKEAKDKAQLALTAVKNGGSSDKDLDKAIVDAEKAIDHLKKFLKK